MFPGWKAPWRAVAPDLCLACLACLETHFLSILAAPLMFHRFVGCDCSAKGRFAPAESFTMTQTPCDYQMRPRELHAPYAAVSPARQTEEAWGCHSRLRLGARCRRDPSVSQRVCPERPIYNDLASLSFNETWSHPHAAPRRTRRLDCLTPSAAGRQGILNRR